MKTLLLAGMLSTLWCATTWASEVQAINFVSLSAEQANSSVFYIKMPAGSVATVSLGGDDKFIDSSGAAGVGIEFEDNIAFIRINDITKASVGLATECGLGLSIVIEQVDSEVDIKEIQPKVHISAADICHK
ncbi:hypothetical protein [Oceanisphaera avium]|uniref:Pilus formation protein N-terminal domain-containing protein n=1 Tax=Oceanisphaera avium TaxID=1903694 RepID=A0A1Y0CZX4_9GAMM|nr:hypothetical protein [Oceanisphaera avium]ART80437.1 hypothetical protein CBP12_10005 [Oceanisphaera avium]